MAQHGWGGNPPRTEDEARQRIIDAATRCIDRRGVARTTLSDVATELDVTRPTVYRYYPGLGDRLVAHLHGVSSPEAAVVEGIVFCVRTIPAEPRLSLPLQIDGASGFGRGATADATVEYGALMLRRCRSTGARPGSTSRT